MSPVTGTPVSGSSGGICTTADVKTRLGETGSTHDTLIAAIINGVSKAFETHCGRPLVQASAAVTEYYTGRSDYLRLDRYPLIAVTSIKESVEYDFDNEDALTVDEDYRIVAGGRSGIIWRMAGVWLGYPDCIQVVYNGGYKTAGEVAGDGETAMPDDLREAAIQQASFYFKRRDDIGITGMSFQGGDFQKVAQVEFLPGVKSVLDKYLRVDV